MPKSYTESLIGDNEKILVTAHQHWFLLVREMLLELVFALVVLVLGVLVMVYVGPSYPSYQVIIVLAILVLLLIPVIGALRDFLIWRNRQFVITNFRVIQLTGIFNKSVMDSSLDKINDIKMTQSAIGRLFDYGDIEILTASELGVDLLRQIGAPVRFKTAMLNAKERLEHNIPPAPDEKRPGDIPSMIDQLDKLRQRGVLTAEEFEKKKAELLSKL